jgi:hypothetical protein
MLGMVFDELVVKDGDLIGIFLGGSSVVYVVSSMPRPFGGLSLDSLSSP